ncbi:MAG: mycofactocin-associated electron transfer flavoprotein beta subunit [Acidimicrobiales bacterium]
MGKPLFAACWKAVELRSRIDPLSGDVAPDPRSLGVSPSDEAALEWALRSAERWGGRVRLVAAGGPDAEAVLRRGAAAGATELVRVDLPIEWPSDWIAAAVAPHVADADLVWCGDMSADRGSGAFPAYLAAELGIPQALGLVDVHLTAAEDGAVRFEVLRRLDGGRRERVGIGSRAVLSCEGATARLRRASLEGVLAAREAAIAVRAGERGTTPAPEVESIAPFRPRARVVAPPGGGTARERIRSLTGADAAGRTARAISLGPREAAAAILEALAAWGELPDGLPRGRAVERVGEHT